MNIPASKNAERQFANPAVDNTWWKMAQNINLMAGQTIPEFDNKKDVDHPFEFGEPQIIDPWQGRH